MRANDGNGNVEREAVNPRDSLIANLNTIIGADFAQLMENCTAEELASSKEHKANGGEEGSVEGQEVLCFFIHRGGH